MKYPFKNLFDSTGSKEKSFVESLQTISDLTKDENKEIRVDQIFHILSGKGYAALLIVFSLPFCLPIQIPGFSTPFGLILAILGFRLAFAKHHWWPKWILEKSFSNLHVHKLVEKMIHAVQKVQKVLRPRLYILTQNSFFHRLNGIIVFFLALLLSLPLPLPFTNILTALPIFCIGLGQLEDDGVFIMIGYSLAFVGFAYFLAIFLLGTEQFSKFF